jgi:polysaccharide export outer membrane protein
LWGPARWARRPRRHCKTGKFDEDPNLHSGDNLFVLKNAMSGFSPAVEPGYQAEAIRIRKGALEHTHMKTLTTLTKLAMFAVFALCLAAWAQDGVQPRPAAAPAAGSATSDSGNPGAPNAGPTSQPQLQERRPRYMVHAGDSFDITFELSPEFDQTGVAIQPDGYVSLRGVGDLNVDGQTVPQLTETLRTAYSKILHDPIISVTLRDFEKPYFVADGQIAHPGKYDLRGSVTLTQALAIAGGFREGAKNSQVLLFRRVNEQWLEAKLFNVKKMRKTGKMDEDPFLHSGDMLFVPKTAISKFDRFIPQTNLGTMIQPY